MAIEEVRFFSGGVALAGTLKLPDDRARRSRRSSRARAGSAFAARSSTTPTTRPSLAAGIAVLVFDYRGLRRLRGRCHLPRSDDPGRRLPRRGHLPRDPRRDRRGRIGAFGSGGTGGGNAIYAAGAGPARQGGRLPGARRGRPRLAPPDAPRARVAGVPRPVRRGRPRAARGTGEARAGRRRARGSWSRRRSAATTTVKADVDDRVPEPVQLASAEAIFAYRPIDVVDRIAPRALMLIAVENDATTPEDHSYALYERAGGAQAARGPDRHDPLRRVRAVPRSW